MWVFFSVFSIFRITLLVIATVPNAKKLPKSLICALHCANSLWIQVSVSPHSLPLGMFGRRHVYNLAPKVLYWWCRFVQNLVNKRLIVAGSSYFLLAIYIRITSIQKTTGLKIKCKGNKQLLIFSCLLVCVQTSHYSTFQGNGNTI